MKFSFVVRLANINIGIQTPYQKVKDFMKNYVVEAVPLFFVETNETILNKTFDSLRRINGLNFNCNKEYLEYIALHTLIAEKLIDYDVLVMHGSAICVDNKAYIFTAKSGTGKSTHASLWRKLLGERAFMINDDKPLLLCKENEIFVCGSPYSGKHHLDNNVSIKLKGIAYLERDKKNHIEKIGASELFERLYIQTYRPEDSLRAKKALELLNRICKNCDMYRLSCNMEDDAAKVAYEAMRI